MSAGHVSWREDRYFIEARQARGVDPRAFLQVLRVLNLCFKRAKETIIQRAHKNQSSLKVDSLTRIFRLKSTLESDNWQDHILRAVDE